VKRTDLLRKISQVAADKGIDFGFVRQGGNHTVYRCGGQNVLIPRHREINERTALGIMQDLDDQLGEDWWR
jgi:mRNA interferase HicA